MSERSPKPLAVRVPEFDEPIVSELRTGANCSPEQDVITVDNYSLRLNGRPWLPVMGEFHHARYPRREWPGELLKMKLGGIDIASTYVFWIFHEETEGKFNWSGRRDLRAFASICGELGLKLMVRLGPWCHGEVRNGGLPDWLLAKGLRLRSDDPGYLDYVQRFYAEVAAQTSGLLWKDGGPIIGVQVDNEYDGPAEHLLSLKRLAVECGFDVPLYTRTGWPELTTPMPLGELLPLYGGYPDGFWDRSLAEMPPGFAANFLFRTTRNDASVATDQLGVRNVGDETENQYYPYFACEIGGGMAASYHRRIAIDPRDIESLALAKIGSGNNLQGYYMYHGGTNPPGSLTSLQESQSTGYWNDLPELSYDFNAPLGEFGQVRSHYHLLRRMHLFLRDFGREMALMPLCLPKTVPASTDDASTLRWAVRSGDDKSGGYLFVNNYQRLQEMPEKSGVQFDVEFPTGRLCLPETPINIPADTCFFWPLNIDLGGARLVYATAQPVCRLDDGQQTYFVFREVPGIAAEFVFDANSGASIVSEAGTLAAAADGRLRVHGLAPSLSCAIAVSRPAGRRISIILLNDRQSAACWKSDLFGRERILISDVPVLRDGVTSAHLRTDPAQECGISLLPAPPALFADGAALESGSDGLFTRFAVWNGSHGESAGSKRVKVDTVRQAGPLRRIRMGSQNVAEAPTDEDFDQAAVWRLTLPPVGDPRQLRRMAIRYTGDVARLYLDGEFLLDNFYNSTPFELGIGRYGDAVYSGELLLKILPLQKNAPIYLPKGARPEFGESDGVAQVHSIELIDEMEIKIDSNAPELRNGAASHSEKRGFSFALRTRE